VLDFGVSQNPPLYLGSFRIILVSLAMPREAIFDVFLA
jgi:hypothetical protein